MLSWCSTFFAEFGSLLLVETGNTLLMTFISTFFAYLFGIPLGVLVVITAKNSLRPHKTLNMVLGWLVNMGRAFPFIILLVVAIPLTKFLVGTSLGVRGAIVPLVLSAAPFVARMVEQSLQEVDPGLIEAAQAFGSTDFQIIWKVMLHEALPSIIRGATITLITIFGYSAMAGCVGAGGLGDVAIRYGYYRYQTDVMVVTIVLLIVLIQIVQSVGDAIARKIDKR